MISKYIKAGGRKLLYPLLPAKKRQIIEALPMACKAQRNNNRKDVLRKVHFVNYDKKLPLEYSYVLQMKELLVQMPVQAGFYVYPYDANYYRIIPKTQKLICSITVDFGKVLDTTLNELRIQYRDCKNPYFAKTQLSMVDVLEGFINRVKASLLDGDRNTILKGYLDNLLNRKPVSFDEALQKILFYDALFWQANHWHIGLGRLDLILDEYYRHDLETGAITRASAKNMLTEFLRTLNKDVLTKSKTLLGDTGQYILLGGKTRTEDAFENDITELLLEIFSEYNKPDPKLILRVNEYTSKNIWDKAIHCITAGNGSPLIMNEKPIMENMFRFGYRQEDLVDLGTSACWEPLIIGKSFDQNNTFAPIVAYQPLNEIIKSGKEYATFADLLFDYRSLISKLIKKNIQDIEFDVSPLFTLFFEDCLSMERDFTKKGARYSFHGAQVLSFPNTVNALLNIKEKVFDKKLITLTDCRKAILSDYAGHLDIQQLLKMGELKYGSTDPEVLSLSNSLMDMIGAEVSRCRMNGEKVKVGFSSPNYIMSCKGTEATLDGRNANEPFAVHISPLSSNIDLPEILDFASQLNYEDNRINGNIVDFTIPNAYLQNKDKLRDILVNSCKKGLFEVQLNVLDYDKLIDAKAHPEKYQDLIVRVWGFSAYFNDLPELYKDNLIERAKLYAS